MRLLLNAFLWVIGLALLAAAAVFGINATDEELSEAAKKAMALPASTPASPSNGYGDLPALRKAGLDDRLRKSCGLGQADGCLRYARENPELVTLSAQPDEFAARYRAMRAKPEFAEVFERQAPYGPIGPILYLISGQGRSQLVAAGLAGRGDLRGAIAELEAEGAFHRRVAAGSVTLVPRLISLSVLQRDAFFASELARLPGLRAPEMKRLKAVVRPLAESALDVRRGIEMDRAETILWMQTRDNVRLSDDEYAINAEIDGESMTRPWWDPVAPYLYRPNETINRYVAQTDLLLAVADLSSREFTAGAEAARAKARAADPPGWRATFVNPAGNGHPNVAVSTRNPDAITPMLAQAHATQALYTLVSLQIALREAGITTVPAIERALDGPLFKAHPDPFTGQPMKFDAKTGTVGFDVPGNVRVGSSLESVRKRYSGRIAVELAITGR